MFGQVIGAMCLICSALWLLSQIMEFFETGSVNSVNITPPSFLFIAGAILWMLGVCQYSLENIKRLTEQTKTIQDENNKRIITLLAKIAREEQCIQEEQNTKEQR